MTEGEVAIPSCNATTEPPGDADVQPSRTRESLTPGSEEPNFVTVGDQPWWKKRDPAPRESDNPGAPQSRNPFSEDAPSPRCVFRDYQEGARRFAQDALAGYVAYWAFAAVPFTVHMLLAFPLHLFSQRPARFWGFAIAVVVPLAITIANH